MSTYLSPRTKTISITSGKGGVGKTSLVCNIATQLGREGSRVLILDGDLGMANVDIMFNVKPKKTIHDVISGEATLSEVLVNVMPNVYLIPGGSGVFELQHLNEYEKRMLLDQVSQLPFAFDYMLIDTAPGIAENVLYLNASAQEICVVVTPEPTSMTDSYALIKVLNRYYKINKFSVILNQVKDEEEALTCFKRLSDVANQFLYVSLDYKGAVVSDPILRKCTKTQQLVLQSSPQAPSAENIKKIAKSFKTYSETDALPGGLAFFWQQFVGVA